MKTNYCDMESTLQQQVAALMNDNPSVMVRDLAKELQTSEGQIIAALPENMRLCVSADQFIPIWEVMATWEKVTFFAETPGAILEIAGKLPKGKIAHGMYNLMDKSFPWGGHLLIKNVSSIWFVSKPIFGLESHSVQFFSERGDLCFAVYLGRQENKEIIPSVKTGYLELWSMYSQKKGVA